MPAQTANRPWVSPAFGNDFAMQQPQQQQQQQQQQFYNNQLQGQRIDLQPRRNSPMRNQPSNVRGGYQAPTPAHPISNPQHQPHSERIPIRTADGRFVGANPHPPQAPAAQNIPIRQPLYHHPPILPQHQQGPLVPAPQQHQHQQHPQMPGQFNAPPPPLQAQQAQQAQQLQQQQQQQRAAAPPAIPQQSHSHLHGHPQNHPPMQLPMWFGGGKAPAGYETAPVMSTVPFSSPSHPVLQVAPHPSPYPVKIHEALAAEGTNIPMPSQAPTPHPFLKAHSQPQRISPSRMSSTLSNTNQNFNTHMNMSTTIPVQRLDHPIGSSSANIKPQFAAGIPSNIRGGFGAPHQQQQLQQQQQQQQLQQHQQQQQQLHHHRMAQQAAQQPFSSHHQNTALPMWFGEGPTPPFYQRPTEPWHFTYHGKEPIAKAPAE